MNIHSFQSISLFGKCTHGAARGEIETPPTVRLRGASPSPPSPLPPPAPVPAAVGDVSVAARWTSVVPVVTAEEQLGHFGLALGTTRRVCATLPSTSRGPMHADRLDLVALVLCCYCVYLLGLHASTSLRQAVVQCTQTG